MSKKFKVGDAVKCIWYGNGDVTRIQCGDDVRVRFRKKNVTKVFSACPYGNEEDIDFLIRRWPQWFWRRWRVLFD